MVVSIFFSRATSIRADAIGWHLLTSIARQLGTHGNVNEKKAKLDLHNKHALDGENFQLIASQSHHDRQY